MCTKFAFKLGYAFFLLDSPGCLEEISKSQIMPKVKARADEKAQHT